MLRSWSERVVVPSASEVIPGILAFIVLLSFLIAQPFSVCQERLFDEHNEIWGDGSYFSVYKRSTVAQSFTASQNYTLTKISLYVMAEKPTILNVSIQTSKFDLPSGTEICSKQVMGPASHQWIDLVYESGPLIIRGDVYWIVAQNGEAEPNGYRWYDSNADSYSGGFSATSQGSGYEWLEFPSTDLMFRVWGVPLSPNLHFSKTTDKSVIEPGDYVTYSIYFNNTGNAVSKYVWINDSLPRELVYESDSANDLPFFSGLWKDEHNLSYRFCNVPQGEHSFMLTAKLNSSAIEGQEITNWAYLNYTDSIGKNVVDLGDGATSIVGIYEPSIELSIMANRAEVKEHDIIEYVIYINNSGIGTAQTVWVNYTLPQGVHFLASNVSYSFLRSSTVGWVLYDIEPGHHSLRYDVQVNGSISNGTALVSKITLNYTNSRGEEMPGEIASAISIVVSGEYHQNEASWWNSYPFLLGILVLLTTTGGAFFISRRRKTIIDEVFLLHRSGELIKHYTRRIRPNIDGDVLSGMLVAVQDFVRDSFGFERGDLNELSFGKYKIIMAQGKNIIVAAVTAGKRPKRLIPQLKATVSRIEDRLGHELEKWNGLLDNLGEAESIMKDLVRGKVRVE